MVTRGISYRRDFELWWPDYDHKPEKCYGFVQQGLPDMDVAIYRCAQRRLCIQAGGHAGLWPLRLAEYFERVLAFEPEPKLFECMKRNTAKVETIECYPMALGSAIGTLKMRPSVSAGSWRIEPDGKVEVQSTTIDSMDVPVCDAIFLDVEGYEAQALNGAMKTIRKFRPILHVEELPRSKTGIQILMNQIGYRMFKKIGRGDVVYIPA